MTGFLETQFKDDKLYFHISTATVAPCAKNLEDLLEKLQRIGVATIPVSLLLKMGDKQDVFLEINRTTVRNQLQKAVKTIEGIIPKKSVPNRVLRLSSE